MEMFGCNSSNIARYGYDPKERIMGVEFRRGGLYHYKDVPHEVFNAFLEAPSKGSFHYQQIKGNYDWEKVS